MTWLDTVILHHEELESPKSFWYWSALAAISAVVKDNIWLDKQLYLLYPNIYVMLHADSGLKKGPPVSMAKKLVNQVNGMTVVSGRSSIQGILKEMGGGETLPGGAIKNKSKVFICSSELTSSIVEDKVATTILTDLFDRHWNEGEWKSLLKLEQFSLKDPIVTMLTATNEAHSDEFFVKQDIQGGYFARTFIINESARANTNSLMFPLKYKIDYKELGKYLIELSKIRGQFTLDDTVRHYIDDWYTVFKRTVDNAEARDKTGTLNRFDDSMLKVAMLVNLARGSGLAIQIESIKEAIAKCELLVGNVRKAVMGRGKATFAEQKGIAIRELVERDNHMISRAQLNLKYYLHASDTEWDEIMRQLDVAGICKIESVGNQIIYRMPDNQVDVWKKHFSGK